MVLICDIIYAMMRRMLLVLPLLSCIAVPAARANWEYESEYVAGGWYVDDGSRFVISVRGGASYGHAKIHNDIGELSVNYYANSAGNVISEGLNVITCGVSGCTGYGYIGFGNIGELPAKQNYDKLTFAAGTSIGWVVPNATNWRLEVGWDRITDAHYNATPLFDGEIPLLDDQIGDGQSHALNVQSGSVHSTVSTDVISAMAFYDFFDGVQKPSRTIIPYLGFGLGYASSVTELQLTDIYGDLSLDLDLQKYGVREGNTAIEFYKSKTTTANIAGVLALGVSYGITERAFFDFGARFMYIPKIRWALSDESDTRHRDWFSAKNMIYTNLMLGLRFEF